MYGSVNVPGAAATVERGGAMSAEDKLSLETLKGLVPFTEMVRTRSGNPVIFPDGTAANVKELSVAITPTQEGSGDPSPTNVRPISGVTSVTVTRTGKNLLPLPLTRGAIVNGVDEYSLVRLRSGFIACKPGEPVTLSLVSGTDGVVPYLIYFYDAGKNSVSVSTTMEGVNPFTATAPDNAHYCRIVFRKLDNANMAPDDVSAAQLEINAVATDYEPYQSQNITVQLTDGTNPLTVYGGTLDITTGELTATHGCCHVDGNTSAVWSSDCSGVMMTFNFRRAPEVTGICSILPVYGLRSWLDVRSGYLNVYDGVAARDRSIALLKLDNLTSAEDYQAWISENEFDYVAPLDTPLTYQLTPAQIAALSGYNAITTDAGSVAVTYRADPSLAYAELESNLTNAILSLGAGI